MPNWIFTREHPPTPFSQRRIDMFGQSPEGWPNSRHDLHLFFEAKLRDPSPAQMMALEEQAYTGPSEYMLYDEEPGALWTITGFGSSMRIWVCERGYDLLIPFYPTEGDFGTRTYVMTMACGRYLAVSTRNQS